MTNTTPTTTPPTGDLAADDPRWLFARAVAVAGEVIGDVPADRLHAPTPTDMDVRGMLEHLVMVLHRVASAGRGEELARWPTGAPDIADDGFADAWRAAAHDVQAAWTDDATLSRPTAVPWGTFTGAEVLAIYINEVVVHTWDLTRGTGQRPRWDDDVVAAADRAIHAQLPDAERGPMWEAFKHQVPPGSTWSSPFADAVAVPADAPAIDRLVAWNGRRP